MVEAQRSKLQLALEISRELTKAVGMTDVERLQEYGTKGLVELGRAQSTLLTSVLFDY